MNLREFDTHCLPKPIMKYQVLAKFIVECIIPTLIKLSTHLFYLLNRPSMLMELHKTLLLVYGSWLFLQQDTLVYGLCLKFLASNNVVEYEDLIIGLRFSIDYRAQNIAIHIDSLLVTFQVKGDFNTHNP